jgi:hypothetical protein
MSAKPITTLAERYGVPDDLQAVVGAIVERTLKLTVIVYTMGSRAR